MTSTDRNFLVEWKRVRIEHERLVKRNDGVNVALIRKPVDPSVLESMVDWVFNVAS